MNPAARIRARRGEGERLRGEILAAAEELLNETADESAVSIRAIADRVGVTAPSIYRHFADKDELLLAVCGQVFARLDETLQKAAAGATDPFDELFRKGCAYVEFGLAFPESYRLLFMVQHPPKDEIPPESGTSPGMGAFHHLMESVGRMLDFAPDTEDRPGTYETTCSVWNAVHGIASLRISWRDFPWPPVEEQVATFCHPWRQAYGQGRHTSAPAAVRRAASREPVERLPMVALHESLHAVPGLRMLASKTGEGPAWFSGEREVVTVDRGEHAVLVRLGKGVMRRRREALEDDSRVAIVDEATGTVAVRLANAEDAALVAELVAAVAAGRR